MKRLKKRGVPPVFLYVPVLVIGLFVYSGYMSNKRVVIDPAAFAPLLHLIARAESNNNYNAYFGNSTNATIDFTSMSIAEVLAWQSEYVQQGSPSSAVGRYQIINTTLAGLVRQLGIDTTKKFDKSMQDRLAIALLERRGAREYVNNEMTREQFAANLAQEWAALPKVLGDNPDESYYASDGLNRSRIGASEILSVIEKANF